MKDRYGNVSLRGGGTLRTECDRELRNIAWHPNVRPALAEIALARCLLADSDADKGPLGNPIAYLIRSLGACKGGRPLAPYLTDQPVLDKWAKAEAKVFDSAKVMAAATTAARKFDDAMKQATGKAGGSAKTGTDSART